MGKKLKTIFNIETSKTAKHDKLYNAKSTILLAFKNCQHFFFQKTKY